MVKKPVKPNTRALKAKCVKLAEKLATAGKACFYCLRSDGQMDPHHVIAQSQSALTAARTDNIVPLCRRCHSDVHVLPRHFFLSFFDLEYPGRRLILQAVARCGKKMDWAECYEKLKGDAKIAGIL